VSQILSDFGQIEEDSEDLEDIDIDRYRAIIGAAENYESEEEAIIDELTQNFFDNTIAHYQMKNNDISDSSEGFSAKLIFIFQKEDEKNVLIVEQTGTTGILKRKEYLKFAAESKDFRDSGSRGQGWKVVFPYVTEVFTETQTEKGYFQSKVFINHDLGTIKRTKWFNRPKYTREMDYKGTRIKFIGFTTELFDRIYTVASRVIAERWYLKLRSHNNYKIIIVKKLENDLDERREIVKPPNLPPLTHGLIPVDKKTHTFQKGRPKETYVMGSTWIGHTNELLSRGIRPGIALISRDHTVTWYAPKSAKNLPGNIFGFIDVSYLKDHEKTTHHDFRNVIQVIHTYQGIEDLSYNIVDQVVQLDTEFQHVDIADRNINFMEFINQNLTKIVPDIDSYDQGMGINPASEVAQLSEKDEILHLIKLKPKFVCDGDKTKCKVKFLSRKEFTGKINITIDNQDYKTDEITLKPDVEYSYEFSFEIESNNSKSKRRKAITLLVRDEENKPIEKKTGYVTINQYIEKFLITGQTNLRKGESINLEYLITSKCRYDLSNAIVKFSVRFNGNQIHESKKLLRDKTGKFNYDISNEMDRGEYFAIIELYDSSENRLDRRSKKFYVEKIIQKMNSPNNIVSKENSFLVDFDLINPTDRQIKGSIKLEVLGDHFDDYHKQIDLLLEAGEEKNVEMKVKIPLDFPDGTSIVKGHIIENSQIIDTESVRIHIVKKDKSGTIRKIIPSRNRFMKDPAIITPDGTIEINTQHYLFKRLDSPRGIDPDKFVKDLSILIYYALRSKDIIPEEIDWWIFEELF
jgi:hypothetical protein